MRHCALAACCALVLVASRADCRSHSETFDGPIRQSVWDARNGAAPNRIATADGRLHITVGIDQLVLPWDASRTTAPMILTEPPRDDGQFTLETRMRVLQPGGGAWMSMAGLAMIRRDGAAAWVWGMLDADQVALRAHDMERVGEVTWLDVEAAHAADGVWLQIVKDGDGYTFRHRPHADDTWTDTTVVPWGIADFPKQFSEGDYLVGIIAAGGGQEARVEFDYFDSPELGVVGVDAAGKLPLAWATLRAR